MKKKRAIYEKEKKRKEYNNQNVTGTSVGDAYTAKVDVTFS